MGLIGKNRKSIYFQSFFYNVTEGMLNYSVEKEHINSIKICHKKKQKKTTMLDIFISTVSVFNYSVSVKTLTSHDSLFFPPSSLLTFFLSSFAKVYAVFPPRPQYNLLHCNKVQI